MNPDQSYNPNPQSNTPPAPLTTPIASQSASTGASVTPSVPTSISPTSQPNQQTQPKTPDIKGFIAAAKAQGKSSDAIYANLKQLGYVDANGKITTTKQTPPKPGFIQSLGNNIMEGLNQIGVPQAAGEFARIPSAPNIGEGIIRTGEAIGRAPFDLLGGILSPFSEMANAADDATKPAQQAIANLATSAIPDSMKENIKNALSTPAVQKTAALLTKHVMDNPEAMKDINAALGWMLTGFGGEKAAEGVGNIAEKVGEVAQPMASDIAGKAGEMAQGAKEAVGTAMDTVKTKATDMAHKSSINDWTEPSTKSGYAKATNVFKAAADKGHNVAEILVNDGIKKAENVKDGKFASSDTADQLRTDVGKMSNDLLRPSLQRADSNAAANGEPIQVPVEDLVRQTIKDVQNTKGETAGNIEAQVSKIKSEGDALARKYPNGMNLTQMHDNKINYSSNGGYNFGDTPDTGNIKAINRAFGRVLGRAVENNAPEEIPVHEFNAELTKQYQAAEYLDKLDGKKAPIGKLAQAKGAIIKGAGTMAGSMLGGGIMGEVAGYHLGGMLNNFFDSMSNPLKEHFLNNLEITNPKAFEQVKQYIGTDIATKLQQKALPPASFIPMGNRTYIEPGVPRTTVSLKPNNLTPDEIKLQQVPQFERNTAGMSPKNSPPDTNLGRKTVDSLRKKSK